MGIWSFEYYSTVELKKIKYHIDELEKLGIQLDSDMVAELYAEIERRNEDV